MHASLSKNKSSNCQNGDPLSGRDQSIGDLFRKYGESYIKTYKPDYRKIKLIRSIRVCRTPVLGGKKITCKGCGKESYIYFSCGNSQCPICQGLKRMQWSDRLRSKLLKVPYVHTVFTLPHKLNNLARNNKREIYGLLMRTSWRTVKHLTSLEENLGGLPGMTSVIHTFGSDMKYHIHVHCLISFGGLKGGKWKWPKHKKRLANYRDYCEVYRDFFMEGLKKLSDKGAINYAENKGQNYAYFEKLVGGKRWVVHSEPPTAKPEVLTEYLSRYICKIAISKHRLHFDKVLNLVTLEFKDYKNQKKGQSAPIVTKSLSPLVAIDQILQHVLPLSFQKSRNTGLHHGSTIKRLRKQIPKKIKENGYTVRKIFELISIMLGYPIEVCPACGGIDFETDIVMPDRKWIKPILMCNKAPPNYKMRVKMSSN